MGASLKVVHRDEAKITSRRADWDDITAER